jgi:hypothetical protein
MASFKHTFTSGQTVTPARLNDARDVFDIVNADIKSDAAIVGTKIAPNFGSQDIVTEGTSFVQSTSTVQRGSNVPETSANLVLQRQRAGGAVVQSGDTLGQLLFNGQDGTNFVMAAGIAAAVDGTPGTNDMPGRLIFSTTADGSSTPTERMRITSDGSIGINNSAPAYSLDVGGAINSTAVYRIDGTQVVTNRQTGWGAPTGNATRSAFATSSVTLAELAQRVKALIDDLRDHGLIGN